MNVARLIEDLSSDINLAIRVDQEDASLALVANLITNVISGDTNEDFLIVFLDKQFLTTLIEKKIHVPNIQMPISTLLYGFLTLITQGRLEKFFLTDIDYLIRSALQFKFCSALPLDASQFGENELINHLYSLQSGSAPLCGVKKFPDNSQPQELINSSSINAYFLQAAFTHSPLLRSFLKVEALNQEDFVHLSSDIGYDYIYQNVSSTSRDMDCIGYPFSRWVNLGRHVVFFKENGMLRHLMKPANTISIDHGMIEKGNKIFVSISLIGTSSDIKVRVGAIKTSREITCVNRRSILIELNIQPWVSCTHVTIETDKDYFANIDIFSSIDAQT